MQRAAVLWEIARLQEKDEQSEIWWKQLVDSTLIAVDGNVQGANDLLLRVRSALQQDPDRAGLLAYMDYQRLVGSYAREFEKPGTDFVAVQKEFIRALEGFVAQYPRAPETAEALLQIGVSYELLGEADQAKKAFQRVAAEFPQTHAARKAAGALRRLELVGKPFDWSLLGLPDTTAARFRRKHVVVYFWAPWCDPCKQELGSVAAMQRNFGASALEVVSVVLDNDSAAAGSFLRSIGAANWVSLMDRDGLDGQYAERFGVFSLPTAFLVGPEGVVVDRNATSAEIRAALDRTAARR